MLTITIIFTLLVVLWGHSSAIAAARVRRDSGRRPGADHGSAAARLSPPIASRGH